MRTLLIASQKGGVGKTTTAVNLAALAARAGTRVLLIDADPLGSVTSSLQLLRSEGDIVPQPDEATGQGLVWSQPIENVDVVSPYPDGDPSDERLQEFLTRLPKSSMAKDYDLVVVDAPPMMGPRPKMLLKASTEVVIVQRAEPMSFRTLPQYLDLMREVRQEGGQCELRGILMTLPSGMAPGSKAEDTLRSRFKGLLAESIPFAPDVNQALVLGRPIVETHPDSIVTRHYQSIAVSLGLATADQLVRQYATAGGGRETNDFLQSFQTTKTPNGLMETKAEINVSDTPAPRKALKTDTQSAGTNADLKSDLIWLTLASVAVLVTLATGVWLLAGGLAK